jgi:hypothetical protein
VSGVFAVAAFATWLRDEGFLPAALQHWKSAQVLHYWPPAWVWALLAALAILEGSYRIIRRRSASPTPEKPALGAVGINVDNSPNAKVSGNKVSL